MMRVGCAGVPIGSIDDALLVDRTLAGDAEAYASLVRQYGPPLRRSVRRLLPDADAADDAVQHAFVTAFDRLDRYDPSHKFFSWVYRIAWNGALNECRRTRRLTSTAPTMNVAARCGGRWPAWPTATGCWWSCATTSTARTNRSA